MESRRGKLGLLAGALDARGGVYVGGGMFLREQCTGVVDLVCFKRMYIEIRIYRVFGEMCTP